MEESRVEKLEDAAVVISGYLKLLVCIFEDQLLFYKTYLF